MGKRENFSKRAIFYFPFASMLFNLFNNKALIYRDCWWFCRDVFKVVCCRFVLYGKGLYGSYRLLYQTIFHEHHKTTFGPIYAVTDLRNMAIRSGPDQPAHPQWLYTLFNSPPPFTSYRKLFENMATKAEIAQNEQFLLLSPCFQLCSIIVPSFKGVSNFVRICFQNRLLHICCMRERERERVHGSYFFFAVGHG